jgi:hypothetical protein
MKLRDQLLFLGIVGVLLFSAIRLRHYLSQREDTPVHDKYMLAEVPNTVYKCPKDMDMFGLKFSIILVLAIFNLFLTIYLIFSIGSR